MRRLLIATRNKGKFLEIKEFLKGLPFELSNLNDAQKIPKNFDVEETGKSFLENAILKAKTFGRMSGFLTLGDDSGLEVEALAGRPGIYSARYATGEDEDRYRKLLEELKDIPEKKRGARFHCLVVVFDPRTKKLASSEGICQGKIIDKPKGKHGFGYDPIFYLPKFKKTMAQLKLRQKNAISHRGKALKKVRKILKKFL